jgi:hypothetical protein
MVKILSSYINFAIGQYIVEPKRTLKNWVKPYVQTEQLKDVGYIYYNNINTPDYYYLSSNNTITAKVILKKEGIISFNEDLIVELSKIIV